MSKKIMRVAGWGDLKRGTLFPALEQISLGGLIFGRGHFENDIRPFKMDQIVVQMIFDEICDTFEPMMDFVWAGC